MEHDVCVFGAGPAGVATALRLAGRGLGTVVLDRPAGAPVWAGETFSGAIRAPLEALGLWDGFRAAGHLRGFEIRSAWESARPVAASTIDRAHGANWHVDRARFDGDLRAALPSRGVEVRRYRKLADVCREAGAWTVRLDEGPPLRARFLVDATGRCRALARRLGVRHRRFDALVALVAQVPRHTDPAYGNAIVVEAVRDGWWYAAPVPRGHVLAYLTDCDLVPAALRARSGLRVVAADSALIEPGPHAHWLAAGDAFAAHDPLCGWGVARALVNGIAAADAIRAALSDGDAAALDAYHAACVAQFDRYLEGLADLYARAYPAASEFWTRRARVLAASA